MTLVRFNQQPVNPSFNNLMDDFFPVIPSLFRDDVKNNYSRTSVPVNVKETAEGYELEVVAPGLNKEDFKISLEENLLTISAEKKTEEKKETEKQVRREYNYQSFKRSFTVDEGIDAGAISAKYVNGVLTLNLPKKQIVKVEAKQITIE